MNMIEQVKGILNSSVEASYVVVDDGGAEYSMDEASKKGIQGKVVKKGAELLKQQLGTLLFSKKKVGVSDLKKGMDKARMIKLADQALYTSKEKGRNCVN